MFQTNVAEEIKTHILCSAFFFSKILPFLDNGEKYCIEGRLQMKIQHMRIAYWLPMSTNTQYVILIAFPLQQWLHERASVFRYTYTACNVYSCSHVYYLLSTISWPFEDYCYFAIKNATIISLQEEKKTYGWPCSVCSHTSASRLNFSPVTPKLEWHSTCRYHKFQFITLKFVFIILTHNIQ